MNWSTWLLSAKLAWGKPFLRWSTIISVALCLVTSGLFIATVLPEAIQNNAFAFHYNVYFGIDEVKTWLWVFFFPGIWFVLTMLDSLVAYGFYRTDAVLANTSAALALVWALPWMSFLFYLSLLNT
ncbi:MAG: hypothetical protein KC582_04830 [Candidatus Magasanikbacteria bacterium]|nr:hypothetical protein [Candidatus Magasanikbacteria bacterium]MCA9391549.1 hypothetical protein [Candidatus Magasanikbacteria bacterium]USN52826.1 MAG: hypothetical protein H6759_02030 [Candidatus Nomurabacteria bacterium]HPF95350.1 hypothetical protein [bacterium]